ncbi:MAG: hypothetical protein NTV22_09925 [bacterium]|nr:hypothetical protein [bacterium]
MALTLTARLRVARRISRAALLAVVLAGGVAQASVVKQDFYLPIPENQLQLAFTTIHTGAGNTIDSVFSVVITAPNTVLYFDQWENGYENDLGSPTNVWSTANLGGTQIWGDGNDANGIPPGYVHDTNFPAGAVLTLRNYVTLPRNPAQILFDGRDHLGATKAIIMSRAGWASNIGPVQGCAVEVPSVSDHGQRYICPVGEDVVSYGKFQYVGLYIMGDYDGTTVTIDTDGAGPLAPLTVTLNRGTPYQVNGGIKKGAYVTASLPVQVYMATGDKTATYETRSFTLRPLEKWSSRYLTPVGTAGNGNPAVVFLFNTNPAPMTVAYTSRAASGLLTVPANNGVLEFQVPRSSGTLLVSTNGTVFSVICAAGADPANDYAYDWGFALLPFDGLTTEAIIGWGPGSADLTRNGSPVWATVTTNTTLYVDYHADYAGPLIDPAGHHYDVAYTLAALESKTIYGPGNDQTGMRLYTLDDTLVSATWGEDPSVALPGSPYLDMGTASLPFPVKKLKKNARVVDDVPPVGVSVGDVIEYTASFENQGVLPAITVVVVDEMPPRIAYSNNTTRLDGVLIPDNPSGPAMPLVAPGYTIPFTPAGATKIITYFATIVSNTGSLLNNLSADGLTTSNDLSAYVVNTCAVVFTESTRTPVTFYTVGDPLYLELGDEAANTSPFSLQYVTLLVRDITSGDAETVLAQETGPNTGVFFPTNGLPSSSSTGGAYDGVLHADPGDTLLVTYTNLDHMVCSAAAYFRLPAPTNAQTKVLYLSDPAQALDRVDPFAAGDTTTASTTAARRQSFTQAPVFTMPLYMPAGAAVSITTYLALASGTLAATPAVYATLSYNGTMFYTASNPVFSAVVNSSNLVWNGTLPADVNIASNQAITLTITNAVAGANTFSILYDSSNFPSKILLPTTNVINVTSVGVYSLSYPAGTLVASSPTGAVRYVRITATDPFGAYDIKSIALSIDGPGAGADLNVTLTDAQVVASNVLSKTYQYQWQTSTTPGNYVIFATAREGTEGITAQANTTMQLYQPGVRTLSATEFTTGVNGPRTALYQTNELICVRVADNDQNTNGAIQTVRVVIRSSSGDEEIRTLAETAGDSGIFTGAVAAAASGTVVINNGIVIAPAGAALNVSYTDPSDASDVSSENATFRGAPQTKPLYLSDPAQALDRIDPVAAGSTNTTQTMVLSGGSATITVTATTTNRTANSASLTFSHTAGNGTNRLLIVTVGVGANSLSGSAPALSGVTYGGTAMNLVGSVQSPAQTSANGARSYIYSLTNAAAGPANVVGRPMSWSLPPRPPASPPAPPPSITWTKRRRSAFLHQVSASV